MRLATVEGPTGPIIIAERDGQLVHLHDADTRLPRSLADILAAWPDIRPEVEQAAQRAAPLPAPPVRWYAPIPSPQKIICIGLNYADHAAETGAAVPEEPVVFCKFATTVIGHLEPIELPRESRQVDYEAELVVVIGKGGRHIRAEDAWNHVAGLTCGHDVSARDWQKGKPGGQWLLGKSFDTFAPMGPFLVTADEFTPPIELDIRMTVSGEVLQDSNTRQLIFTIEELIAYLSQVVTLRPGDVLFTGTPPGVGMARKPPRFLKAGDVAQVSIERIGTLENPVISAAND